MKGKTNNPNGRPRKAEVKGSISIRLSNTALRWLEQESEKRKIPKGIIIENLISEQIKDDF